MKEKIKKIIHKKQENNHEVVIFFSSCDNNTQTKKSELNNINNRRIESRTNNTNSFNQSLTEDIRLLIKAIKSSNDLMEKRKRDRRI